MERLWLGIAGLSGALAVGADAAARHLLADDPMRLDWTSTAARYGLYHALALLALALFARPLRRRGTNGGWITVAGWCFVGGLTLFPGSLYLLALGVTPLIPRATPIGGILFIAGWMALFLAAFRWRRSNG